MKLLAKTSLYYLFLVIPILIVSGFICYYFITVEVKESNNDLLLNREIVIKKYLINNDTIPLNLIINSGEAQIIKIKKTLGARDYKPRFSDTLILDKEENELANNRMLTTFVSVNNSNYQIKIWRSTIEFDELFSGIFYFLLFILFFLFLISIAINLWISKKLWQPFYTTVSLLHAFRASENKVPIFSKTSIEEFSDLNKSLETMMNKMIVDYNNQKKFTENASHEMQTPLAVIKSKVDLLFQSENLTKKEIDLITTIEDANSKLSRLTKSLLLLAKIENRQFETSENVSFEKTVNNSLLLFEDHIETQNISIIKEINEDFCVPINPDLCLILINNLIQNAIKYNVQNGKIVIEMDKNQVSISNSGRNEAIIPQLFERFQKQSTSSQSVGLGLSIVKEITDVSGLSFQYHFSENQHQFTLTLNKSKIL